VKLLIVLAAIPTIISTYKGIKDMFYPRTDFPYTEIRNATEDYFDSIDDALEVAHDEYNIWSVMEDEIESNGKRFLVFTYGPSHHYVNVLGYIVTKEAHNGNTYFEEYLEMDD